MQKMTRFAVFALLVVLVVFTPSFSISANFQESPVLTELVAAGQLPPVDERLPEDPFVVGPGVLLPEDDVDWEVGQYGGTLRMAHMGPGWNPDLFVLANESLLRAPGIGTENIQGGVLLDYEVSEDNQVFTFHMRPGLKWSDGMPVTTEDIRFTFEDMLMNPEVTPVFPARYRAGGQMQGTPMELDVLDEYTFRVSFDEPYGTFLTQITIALWVGYTDLLKPSHFLKQFHLDYTPLEDILPHLAEAEFEPDQWATLLNAKDARNWDLTRPAAINFPALYPWVRVEGPSGMIVMERNPYFYKVDTEGNQLPYIDRVESHEVSDTDMINMRVFTGEVDLFRDGTALNRMPLYRENEERGNYRVVMLPNHVNPSVFFLNPTYPDPAWQDLMLTHEFRQAINMAIDREEIVDVAYFGYASVPTTIPTNYDPVQAAQLLDAIGLDQRDDEGYRLRPDGEVLEIHIEFADLGADFVPVTELIVEFLNEVDIKTSMRQLSPTLRGERGAANELIGTMGRSAAAPLWREGVFDNYLPGLWGWAPAWQQWYASSGETGMEPPAEIQDLYRIHEDRLQTIPGSPEFLDLTNQLFDLYYSYIPFFFVVEEGLHPMIASKRLGNVAHGGFVIAANYAGEQMFFKD